MIALALERRELHRRIALNVVRRAGGLPFAMVFASGHVTIPRMVRAGAILDLIAVAAISLLRWLLPPLVLDIPAAGR